MAGAWFDWRFRMGAELNQEAKIIHAHENTAELGRNINCQLEVRSDPGKFLNRISAFPTEPTKSSNWLKHLPRNDSRTSRPTPVLPPYANLYKKINDTLPNHAIVTVDGSLSLSGAMSQLEFTEPASYFDPGLCGLIGGSLPLAMGFKLANPHRPVVALISDTSFGMSGMEWETCVRHGLQIIGIVANNSGNMGSIRDKEIFSIHSEKISSYTSGIRYDLIAKSLGTCHVSISCGSKIPTEIQNALTRDSPTCINVDLPSEG